MNLLSQARAALAHGDKSTARDLVKDALRQDPRDPEAWLLMSGIVDSPDQQRDCLRRVLAIDPGNGAAQRGLSVLEAPQGPPAPSFAAQEPAAAPSSWSPPPARDPMPAAPSVPPFGGTQPPYASQPVTPAPAAPSVPPFGGTQPPYASQPVTPAPAAPVYATPLIDYGAYGPQAAPYATTGYVAQPIKRLSTGAVVAMGVVGALLAVVCVLGGLSALGRNTAPPPTPKVSAQDRTTAFLNDLFTLMLNPRFLDPDTMAEAAKPLEQYIVKNQRTGFTAGLRIGFMQSAGDTESLKEIMPLIQRISVEGMRYQVVEQTDRKTVLRITSGNVVLVLKDGNWTRQPIKDMFGAGTWTYVNQDGVWYLNDLKVLE